MNALSRAPKVSTSLINPLHAEGIAHLVDRLLGEGVEASDIGQALRAGANKAQMETLDRILSMSFASSAVNTINADSHDWRHLPVYVRDQLDALFSPSEGCCVTLWFTTRGSASAAYELWGRFLRRAINRHLPPLFQYQDKERKFVCDIDATPPIHDFYNGIYNLYPKKVQGKGKANAGKVLGYHGFPLSTQFDTYEEMGLTFGIPVVRDLQYQNSLVAHIAINVIGSKDWLHPNNNW